MPWRIKEVLLVLLPFLFSLCAGAIAHVRLGFWLPFSWLPFISIPRDVVSTHFFVEQRPA